MSLYEPPQLGIEISNQGNKTTTIVKAYYVLDPKATITPIEPSKPVMTAQVELDMLRGQPIKIPPGEVVILKKDMTKWPVGISDPSSPITPTVIDSHGHKILGKADDLIQKMLKSGWKPQDIPDKFANINK